MSSQTMQEVRSLENKVAIITGGGRGLGASVAKLFAKHGAKVVVASRTASEVEATVAKIRTEVPHGGSSYKIAITGISTDVSSEDQVRALFRFAQKEFGPPDILVNNAGYACSHPIESFPTEEFDRIVGVNLRGAFLCAREAFQAMEGRGGVIINVSSLAGIRGTEKFPGFSAYAASKHAVVGLTEALAAEGKPKGIRVNCIAPGTVDTQMLRGLAPHLRALTQPDDVAETFLFLADSRRSLPLNGAIVETQNRFENG